MYVADVDLRIGNDDKPEPPPPPPLRDERDAEVPKPVRPRL